MLKIRIIVRFKLSLFASSNPQSDSNNALLLSAEVVWKHSGQDIKVHVKMQQTAVFIMNLL